MTGKRYYKPHSWVKVDGIPARLSKPGMNSEQTRAKHFENLEFQGKFIRWQGGSLVETSQNSEAQAEFHFKL